MRKFTCLVRNVRTFLHLDNKGTSFSFFCTLLWSEICLDNYLFIGPENLRTSLKIKAIFSERKYIDFCCVQLCDDISTISTKAQNPLTINYPMQYTKRQRIYEF